MVDGQKGCGLEIILAALCLFDLDMNGGNVRGLLAPVNPVLDQIDNILANMIG